METLLSSKKQSWLSWFLRGFLILGFLILISRLVDLTIIKGEYYRNLSEGNRIKRISIVAPRGKILARGGETLVGNNSVETQNDSGDELIIEWYRNYPLGSELAHVTGFLGEVNSDELGKINAQCPNKGPRQAGSLIGRGGLEEEYDCMLRGIDGEELTEVDAQGKKVRIIGRRDPLAGEDLKTSIHYDLQKKAAQLMNNQKGAIVITDTKGEILALYSSPSFDPNIFISNRSDKVSMILNDDRLPMFNRAMGGIYHPGSVFKPVVAIAALEENEIDKEFIYKDIGVITIETPYGEFTYTNWLYTQHGGSEGEINIVRAIARSTDTFFYKIGEFLTVEKIIKWANKFHLNETSKVDLPGEVAGLVPSPSWKLRVKGEKWFLGNTYHMSIGQGDIALTPLGINMAINAIAGDGMYCYPHLTSEGRLNNSEDKQNCESLNINPDNIKTVKEGMKQACLPGGTASVFFDFTQKTGIEVACKTGTAETEEEDKTHAWFVVFAPVDSPEIVATVLIEKGGEGSKVAAPIAQELLNYWFGSKQHD